ncbi:SMI1/KNR4 family protein [Botryobacter ruber]|uniref:SMI1/KNR4 family protein n=1 Tax=Botryobacter ruber TaxID=2171629 RepID=UPI0013E304A3|nr:SMI1/KNR4 family protein [Botryobacter ruber]
MNEIQVILAKYKVSKQVKSNEEALNEIEIKTGFKLPEDYKNFLLNYKGFENLIGEEYVNLWDLNELVDQNEEYQIIENLSATIGIGSNGAGELIALEEMSDGKIRVVLTPLVDLSEESHIHIGDSFTDFLQRLDKGQEWFSELKI